MSNLRGLQNKFSGRRDRRLDRPGSSSWSVWTQGWLRVVLIVSAAWLHLAGTVTSSVPGDLTAHCEKTSNIYTPMQFDRPDMLRNPDLVTFSVEANAGAIIGLSETGFDSSGSEMYEIVLGTDSNTKSKIGRCRKGCPWFLPVDTPDILDDSEPRFFWIKINGSSIEVGKLGIKEPFMSKVDTTPIPVRHLGYASESPSTWNFCGE